jgi:hypothetical protein
MTMKLKSLALAIAIGATAMTASVTTADAYYPSQYCRHHFCAGQGHWRGHWHCRWYHGHRRCWR